MIRSQSVRGLAASAALLFPSPESYQSMYSLDWLLCSLMETTSRVSTQILLVAALHTYSCGLRLSGDLEEVWPPDMWRSGPPVCGYALVLMKQTRPATGQ